MEPDDYAQVFQFRSGSHYDLPCLLEEAAVFLRGGLYRVLDLALSEEAGQLVLSVYCRFVPGDSSRDG